MKQVFCYVLDLNSGIYSERGENLPRLPQMSEYVKLDDSLRPYMVDAVVEHTGSLPYTSSGTRVVSDLEASVGQSVTSYKLIFSASLRNKKYRVYT